MTTLLCLEDSLMYLDIDGGNISCLEGTIRDFYEILEIYKLIIEVLMFLQESR